MKTVKSMTRKNLEFDSELVKDVLKVTNNFSDFVREAVKARLEEIQTAKAISSLYEENGGIKQ